MKGGNTVKLFSILVLAIWSMWTGAQSHATCNTSGEHSIFQAPNYPKVQYTVDTSNPDTYRIMVARLRALLTGRGEYRQGIPILPEQGSVRNSELYILLEISSAGRGVTFAIDVTNIYIVGYVVGSMRYFFEEAPARADQLLFTDAAMTSATRRSSNYASLENRARARRETIPVGLPSLDEAIRTLVTERPEDPRSLLVVIQMVAEAVRYWEIEWRILQGSSFNPDRRMLDFENNWSALSARIQTSGVFAFHDPITIGNEVADSVQSAVIRTLVLMLFTCAPRPQQQGRWKHLMDPATEVLGRDLGLSLDPPRLQTGQVEDEQCKHLADPRSRIMGRDGLCIEVVGFNYRDKNPVNIATCKSTDFRNQLWNFQTDGRIVSMEKCLAATGVTPGSTLVIHECDTLHASAVQWVMSNSGTLSNRVSGLVLTAASGTPSQLTLESDTSSSFQAWQSTNTTAVDVYIQGENSQCIYYDGKYGVYTQGCVKDNSWQKWRLYPDGTIRPMEWLEGCLELGSLSLEYLTASYNYIQAGYCSSDSEKHRWIFTHNGTIMNLKSKFVVDADRDYPTYLKAASFEGGLNQIWRLDFT